MNDPAGETAQSELSPPQHQPHAGELRALLDELRALEEGLPLAAREKLAPLLDAEKLSFATGVAPERITALLNGAQLDNWHAGAVDAAEGRQHSRLVFLRETRLKRPMTRRLSGRTPRPYTFGEIARGAEEEGAKISKQTVHYIFTEGRKPSAESLAGMERFFGVLPGFCSYTENEALVARLRPVVQQLRLLNRVAAATAHGVTRIAARSTEDLSNADERESILSALLDTGVLDDLDPQRDDQR
ncbi:hypothetical protein ACFWFI_35210 [Streptomyces sp. NPDC060209]|uniref:hypothetical protein n=1 Tax=Streptomyces sp. NPDC060209 TaxID=3347073 RepID=UPI0036495C05